MPSISERESEAQDNDDTNAVQLPRYTTPAFITLMSQLLTFHAYNKLKSFWKKNNPDNPSSRTKEVGEMMLHEARQEMLNQLKTTLPRSNGYGWNIKKVHDVFYHLVRQIREYGRWTPIQC
jgi:hypothetical protein